MNHPSEWTNFFDENTGRYRYKHKGSGLIRDTLMAIGKAFKGTAKNVLKTAADKTEKTVAEKAGQKVGEIAVQKGSKQIQEILRKRKPKPQKVSHDVRRQISATPRKHHVTFWKTQVTHSSGDSFVQQDLILRERSSRA